MILHELKLDGDVAILIGHKAQSLKVLTGALAEAGAAVVVSGPLKREVEQAADEASKCGQRAIAMPVDVTSQWAIQTLMKKVVAAYGRVDICVNDLSVPFGKPFVEMTASEWDRTIETNLKSVFLSSKVIGEHMKMKRSGRIVNIISGLAERGLSNGTAYCAAMGAVSQLTRSLALEWARDNVRINAIGTGWMEDEDAGPDDPVARFIPMGRRGRPEDIAPLVILLASKGSSYQTGYIYFVDGGLMARG
jgi:NAD(P)-dependent dehydrogenase (short-subunit alcohol dehydrogenase family)